MGQKVNPIAVRLNFNRFSDSSWFSDYYYSTLIYQDFNFRQYIYLLRKPNTNKLGFRSAKCILHHFPKRSLVHLFCLSDPRKKAAVYSSVMQKTGIANSASFEEAGVIQTDSANPRCMTGLQLEPEQRPVGAVGDFRIKPGGPLGSVSDSFGRATDYPITNSAYWFNSSILQKKRALVNLHRLLLDEKWSQYSRGGPQQSEQDMSLLAIPISSSKRSSPGWFPKDSAIRPGKPILRGRLVRKESSQAYVTNTRKRRALTGYFSSMRHAAELHSRLPELWSCLSPGIADSGRPILKDVCQQLRSVLLAEPPMVRFQVFNFYAIHYFFMQKIGDSLGRLPYRIVKSRKHAFTTQPLPQFTAETGQVRLGRGFSVSRPPLTYRSDSVWPMSSVRHLSPTRTSRVLSLARSPVGFPAVDGFSLDTHIVSGTHSEVALPSKGSPLRSNKVTGSRSNSHKHKQALLAEKTRNGVGSVSDTVQLTRSHWTTLSTEVNPFDGGAVRDRDRNNPKRTSGYGDKQALCAWSSFFGSVGSNQITKSLDFYLSNVHYILSQNTNTFISMRPMKVHSIFQCASLVAQEVVCKLEQKKSFRLICRLIFQQLAACYYIKGIRITCSGRLNGAEIAKTECRKFGETSLHVFSDKIDYARTKASTPYGILGVKVWISYI